MTRETFVFWKHAPRSNERAFLAPMPEKRELKTHGQLAPILEKRELRTHGQLAPMQEKRELTTHGQLKPENTISKKLLHSKLSKHARAEPLTNCACVCTSPL